MESFNKVLYFILGLVVVIVFVIVFTGRLNLGKTFRPLATISPTPTPKDQKGILSFFGSKNPTNTPTPTSSSAKPTDSAGKATKGQAMQEDKTVSSYQAQQQPSGSTAKGGALSNVQSIPATGAPTQILLLAIPALAAGFSLRKRK